MKISLQSTLEYSYTVYSCQIYILEKDSRELKSIEINHKIKILAVVFMLLFKFQMSVRTPQLSSKKNPPTLKSQKKMLFP